MHKCFVIAEAGVNHNGNLNRAIELIHAAKEANADYVKFQSFKADKLVSPTAKKAEYQKLNANDGDDSQYSMLKKLELSDEQHHRLIEECKNVGINFLSTAFDTDGLHYLNNLGIPLFKIPSGEITNYMYLKTVAGFGKPIILSTGMSTMDEIRDAVTVLNQNGCSKEQITVLHCNTEYPTPMEDVNLKAMISIQQEIGVKVGYSDHTMGIEVPIAAVALGALVIEKHFTLDRSLPGPDHKASLEPGELKAMVTAIRNIELAISGDGIKKTSSSEKKNITIARKSLHTTRIIQEGETIGNYDLIALRPGDGISPMRQMEIVGKKAKKTINALEKITLDSIQ
jgi:N,N'-diacetyllegionaminate synthase